MSNLVMMLSETALPLLPELPQATATAPVRIPADLVARKSDGKAAKYTVWTWTAIICVLLIHRWGLFLLRHIRRLSSLDKSTSGDGKHKYFSIPFDDYANFKRHIILAPLWTNRHTRELKLSAATDMGNLPSRLQTLFLLVYLGMQIAFYVWTIDWSDTELRYHDARNITGALSVLNMIPLFLSAGRNNPLIYMLGINFDTYISIHRWIGHIVVIEGVIHTAFWMSSKTYGNGWDIGPTVFAKILLSSRRIQTGMVSTGVFILLMLLSPSVVRHAFYETFLGIHILLTITAVVGVWLHCKDMHGEGFIMAATMISIAERVLRFTTILRRNFTNTGTKVEVEALPGDAVRVTLHVPKAWKFTPGQHVYLYMPSVGHITSHPFSLVWSEEEHDLNTKKADFVTRGDAFGSRRTKMFLIIRRRTGFTNSLFKRTQMSPEGRFITSALVEGPYGGESFASYGTVMLFASGVGITHQIPHVRDLVAGYANGTHATRKVTLVWIIQSPKHLEWIRPWMTQILGMEKRRNILRILLFVTRPHSSKEIHPPDSSLQIFPGRPDCDALIQKEQDKQIGAMAISVCGTGGLADDVRMSVRDRCTNTEIDIFEAAFSW